MSYGEMKFLFIDFCLKIWVNFLVYWSFVNNLLVSGFEDSQKGDREYCLGLYRWFSWLQKQKTLSTHSNRKHRNHWSGYHKKHSLHLKKNLHFILSFVLRFVIHFHLFFIDLWTKTNKKTMNISFTEAINKQTLNSQKTWCHCFPLAFLGWLRHSFFHSSTKKENKSWIIRKEIHPLTHFNTLGCNLNSWTIRRDFCFSDCFQFILWNWFLLPKVI